MESERQSRGIAGVSRAFLIIVALIGFDPDNATRAADVSKSDTATEDRVQALIPAIEAYIASGMRGFDVPGNRRRRQTHLRQGLRGAQQERGDAGRYTHDLPDRFERQSISRCDRGDHG